MTGTDGNEGTFMDQVAGDFERVVEGERPRFVMVENLTSGLVTLHHPSLEDARHKTVGPRRKMLMDIAMMDNPDNVELVNRGIISWKATDSPIKDDGREAALGSAHALEDRQLEYLALQVLLFPADDLEMRDDRGIRPGDALADLPALANVVYQLITAAPRRESDKRLDVTYLKETHLPLLENILARERLWQKREAIIGLLERRIGELSVMDATGRVL